MESNITPTAYPATRGWTAADQFKDLSGLALNQAFPSSQILKLNKIKGHNLSDKTVVYGLNAERLFQLLQSNNRPSIGFLDARLRGILRFGGSCKLFANFKQRILEVFNSLTLLTPACQTQMTSARSWNGLTSFVNLLRRDSETSYSKIMSSFTVHPAQIDRLP